MTTKCCNRCGEEKPLDAFRRDSLRFCRECERAYARDYYARNPEKFAAKRERDRQRAKRWATEYRKKNGDHVRETRRRSYVKHAVAINEQSRLLRNTVEGRAKSLVNGAKSRLPENFSLEVDYVIEKISAGICPVTGFEFSLDGEPRNPFAPSLDRVDPRKPYTNENVRVVIWQYNAMKGEITDESLLAICRRIVERAA